MVRKSHIALIGVALLLFVSGWFTANLDVRPELREFAARPGFAEAQRVISSLFVVGLALPSLWALLQWCGVRRGLVVFGVLGAFAIGIETVALHTGLPYGRFAYGPKIGGKMPGDVPWTVPFAWTPLVLGASFLMRHSANRVRAFSVGGALWLVAFDLLLDPGAVSQGFWVYLPPGAFWGVPASNFAGWLFSGVIGLGLLWRLSDAPNAPPPPVGLLASTWLIVVFWTSVAIWKGLWLPALCGVVLWAVAGRLLFAARGNAGEPALAAARPLAAQELRIEEE